LAATITIIGCGPGSPDYITHEAAAAAESAGVIFGHRRLLELFPSSRAHRVEIKGNIDEELQSIEERLCYGPVAILVSGDPGVFSFSRNVVEKFGRSSCRVIPGISSVQVAFSRLGLDWTNSRIISAHKKDPDPEILENLSGVDRIAVLAGRPASMKWIVLLAQDLGSGYRYFVFQNLTLPDERVFEASIDGLYGLVAPSRTIVLIIKDGLL
jgi:cobalt-precorrin-7 (C5)-methyltransferase